MPTRAVATIIVDPHMLVREGLTSVISTYSYHVLGRYDSAKQIRNLALAEDADKLAIVGAQTTERAISDGAHVRGLWPACKIVLLVDHLCASDLAALFESDIDGCVPLDASHDVLIGALDLVMAEDERVMIVPQARLRIVHRQIEDSDRPLRADSAQDLDGSNTGIVPSAVNGSSSHAAANSHSHQVAAQGRDSDGSPRGPARSGPRLSGRESQILSGLVKGLANKIIARQCDITESTVKVHMKSILRKIQVANRTQAAIWAREHGYAIDGDITERLLNASELGAVA